MPSLIHSFIYLFVAPSLVPEQVFPQQFAIQGPFSALQQDHPEAGPELATYAWTHCPATPSRQAQLDAMLHYGPLIRMLSISHAFQRRVFTDWPECPRWRQLSQVAAHT